MHRPGCLEHYVLHQLRKDAAFVPELEEGNTIRLYTLDEIAAMTEPLGMQIHSSYADFSGSPSSDQKIQLLIYSIRK